MNTESLLVTLLVGAVAGWLAGLIMRGSGYGILGNIIVGLVGAVVGALLLGAANISIPLSALIQGIVVAVIGALVLMLIVSMLRPRSFGERFRRFWRR